MNTPRTLILSVDRDDDVGYKAGVTTPAIGREACLEAAVKLGTADPEDSDTNAIFQAIKTYDDQLAKGEDVEKPLLSSFCQPSSRIIVFMPSDAASSASFSSSSAWTSCR